MQINELPPPPQGYTAWRYQVGVDGRISALFSTVAFPQGASPWARLPSDATSILGVLEDANWRSVTAFPTRDYGLQWDIAPDDWCVVARGRVLAREANATAFVDGRVEANFHIGDGVAHVQCDGEDGIWVSYFDEGVFGSDADLGANGLVRLDRNGEKLFAHPGYDIADCYALNVTSDRAWTCYYTDFPIVSMTTNGARQEWSNTSVAGAHSIAVDGEDVALVGGYEGKRDRVAVLKLEKNDARPLTETALTTVFPTLEPSAQIVARNDLIYAIEAHRIRICAVSDLMRF